jgi:hypothetical protein
MEKYIQLAKDLKMEHALLIGPQDIYFDSRAMLNVCGDVKSILRVISGVAPEALH